MNTRMTKNYNTDGGNRTVIGGVLEFEAGAEVKNYPGNSGNGSSGGCAANQPDSTASQVAGLKSDFNALLAKLKNAGIMEPDAWNISVRLAPSLTDEVAAANNGKATVSISDNTITIVTDISTLEESESSVAGQGTHKWIGLGIGTGLSSVTKATYNGTSLTEADATEAASVGLDQAGEFILYVKAEVVAENPITFTLNADGFAETTITIRVAAAS